ncbi:hypothetical protein I4U23_031434 [Adineta vaga]|nr:hypothetical protein I4U23_031434 [Adineta vaga]
MTQLENLANELIYEIFEYLDYYHVYKGFFDLNYRLHSLLMQLSLPLKINLFPMSQTTFNRYNQDIILPNTRRIHTLRIPNHFMFDQDTLALSHKTFLQTLILENIEPQYLNNHLDQLTLFLQLLTKVEDFVKSPSQYSPKSFALNIAQRKKLHQIYKCYRHPDYPNSGWGWQWDESSKFEAYCFICVPILLFIIPIILIILRELS